MLLHERVRKKYGTGCDFIGPGLNPMSISVVNTRTKIPPLQPVAVDGCQARCDLNGTNREGMAWRINEGVVRGEIDNRTGGQVHGRIWLIGRDEPITLELSGNCRRDLAGCLLRFENPAPKIVEDEHLDLAAEQAGAVGDMTASRKVRVLDVSLEEARRLSKAGEPVPEHKANSLYLEWFSDANGRVVIESADYKIDISPPAWTLSAEDEQKQTAATQQAMRD